MNVTPQKKIEMSSYFANYRVRFVSHTYTFFHVLLDTHLILLSLSFDSTFRPKQDLHQGPGTKRRVKT